MSTRTAPKRACVPRLYVDASLEGQSVVLDEDRAHYLRHVLRLKPGHGVVVFNGKGLELIAKIETLTKSRADLRVTGINEPIPESPLQLTLAQGIAKAEAMDLIVQKATELGVHSIVPVVTEFSVVKLDEKRAERRLEHWRRIAHGACEQSGRHTPPIVHAPERIESSLERLPPAGTRLALDPTAGELFPGSSGPPECATPLCILVGPEGGLSHRDLQLAERADFNPVRLGPRILRTETAAITACSLAQAYWGDLPG